jgi:signal transduction histidine kinase
MEESPAQIIRNMASIGYDLGPWERQGLLRFHAVRSTLYGLEQHLVTIHRLIGEFHPACVVLDLVTNLQAIGVQILVAPTLVRRLPEPVRKIVVDLSNEERGRVGLDLRSRWMGTDMAKKPATSDQEALETAARTARTQEYVLRLYVAGPTPRSREAIRTVMSICEEHLAGRYELEVIDLYQQPALARGEQIVAAPTPVKKLPAVLQQRTRPLQKLAQTEERKRRQLVEILHDDLQQQLAAAKFHLSLLHRQARHDSSQQAAIAQVDQLLGEAIQKSRSLSHELSPAVLHYGDLVGALDWLADQMRAKHGLQVTIDAFGAVPVQSEALKIFLYKAAQELLFNVVRHARTDRARVRRRGRCVCLSVSDPGRGFDPGALRQTAGFGLLSIHERIELLGARTQIRSRPGQGSTFHLVVPDRAVARDNTLGETPGSLRRVQDQFPRPASRGTPPATSCGSEPASPGRPPRRDRRRTARKRDKEVQKKFHILAPGEYSRHSGSLASLVDVTLYRTAVCSHPVSGPIAVPARRRQEQSRYYRCLPNASMIRYV